MLIAIIGAATPEHGMSTRCSRNARTQPKKHSTQLEKYRRMPERSRWGTPGRHAQSSKHANNRDSQIKGAIWSTATPPRLSANTELKTTILQTMPLVT